MAPSLFDPSFASSCKLELLLAEAFDSSGSPAKSSGVSISSRMLLFAALLLLSWLAATTGGDDCLGEGSSSWEDE